MVQLMTDTLNSTPMGVNITQRQLYMVFAGVISGLALSALDGTIVNTALATIVGDLGGIKYYAWVGTAYMLTSTTATPLFGKLSDLYGRRRLYQAAIVIFTLGSVLCGISQSMWQLVVSRGVQGIGGGGLMAVAFAIIGDVVAPRERGKYMGLITSIFTFSSVVGPLIGGFIVDNTSWRWIFLVNVPVAALAIAITNKSLRLAFVRQQRKVDFIGATLLVFSVTSLLLGLSWTGDEYGWTSAPTLAFFAAALVGTFTFIRWEAKAPEPIIPLSMLSIDTVKVVVPLMILIGAVFYGANAFMPLFLQGVTGVSATNSGLLLVPMAVSVAITATWVGRITSRTGTYKMWAPLGCAVTATGFTLASFLDSSHGYLYLAMSASFILGIGMGMIMPTGTLAVQNAVDPSEMGTASSVVVFMRQLGGAVGLAAYGALFANQLNGRIDPKLVQAPRMIKKLPSPTREQALDALTHAIVIVFRGALPLIIIAFVVALAMPNRPLRSATTLTPVAPSAD
ncbi:MAG: DHA2 family efflux MFS transporter permease subunit [Acidimicrobiia bacterium]|nr:DHA2 family efflux MFS transporter permease subunit [Actinomycetota bacterium]NDB04444.1 DHA2 family efflux MFS transporter permease subunit [Acidimicrobiia bacterium]NDE81286.1 DHA2 family efflux MFS transporter permease subunit [Actinomycetota bacterium]